ncbi:MAG: peptide chain release factor subunit 1 [Actinomycetota bacterium]|nr:peptide chain release factor subunit 1 [Actinomycetota bacterium]
MTLLSEESIRNLASFKASDRPVVTAYLDVDGKRWPRFQDVESRIDHMVRDAIDAASANGHKEAVPDLERIAAHVRRGLDRSRTRGLALFSCGDALWETFELPVRVKDHLVVNQSPHVRQLETVVDNYPGLGMLLVDKQRARMFVFELTRLVDKSELFDELPRNDDEPGEGDRGEPLRSHLAEAARRHVKRAAAVAFEAWKQHPFDHLVVCAGPEVIHDIDADLHSYLKERVAAHVSLPTNSSESAIVAAALEVEERLEREKEAAVVTRMREAAGAGRGGVAGLEATLAALCERRVDTLIVSDGFEAEGWRCGSCLLVSAKGRRCSRCDGEMTFVDDVVEEAVEEALLQSCHVEMVVGNADLDVAGRIGALLRF